VLDLCVGCVLPGGVFVRSFRLVSTSDANRSQTIAIHRMQRSAMCTVFPLAAALRGRTSLRWRRSADAGLRKAT
jgi:hypothetical protein